MKITLRSGWDQVNIKEYMDIKGIYESQMLNDLEKEIKILSILSGLPDESLNVLTIPQLKLLFKSLKWLDTEPVGEIKDYYFIGNKKYKLIKEVKDLNAGQFIDLCNYTKDKDLIIDNLPMILSVLLLPVKPLNNSDRLMNKIYKQAIKIKKVKEQAEIRGWKMQEGLIEKYMESPIEETSENIFTNMKITEALGISVFFYLLYQESLKAIVDYLETETMNQMKSVSKMLPQNQKIKKINRILKEIGFMQNGIG